MRVMAEGRRMNIDQIEFYKLFLDELVIKWEIAILCGDLKQPDIDTVARFVKWVKEDIVRDAKCERNRGGSFLSRHALKRWKEERVKAIETWQQMPEPDPPAENVARYLADEANPEEQATVIPLLKYDWFRRLVTEIKEVFGGRSEGRSEDGRDAPA